MPSHVPPDERPARRALPLPSSRGRGLVGLGRRAIRGVPLIGVSVDASIEAGERELNRVERLVWNQVRQRMDEAGPGSGTTVVSVDRVHHDPDLSGRSPRTPADLLGELLAESVTQATDEARARLHVLLLEQLVPDEARILAALSDGTSYPLVHIASRGTITGAGPTLLENASTVGRSAGVALPEHVPTYVTHLRALGLAMTGAERGSLHDAYEMLLTEKVVQSVRETHQSTRVLRRTLSISPLGRELWQACEQDMPVGELLR